MSCNVGRIDRAFRIIIGIFILSLMFWGPKSYWALLGIIPLGTGLLGRCGLYSLIGLNTCKTKESTQ